MKRMGPAPSRKAPAARSLVEREAVVLARERALKEATRALDLRELDLRAREEGLKARAEVIRRDDAQLREANERLVVATVDAQEMTEVAEQTSAKMSFSAEHDFLTGLANRALLTDHLRQAVALAQRHERKTALMYLDLDHFKHINDSFGHAVGDQVLQSVAKRIQACVRLSDTVSRFGGDEFVVLLAEVRATEDTRVTAEKLIKAMSVPHLIGGEQLNVTLSIGVSLYPDDAQGVDSLIRNADAALYHAKKSGRNCYQLFRPDRGG